MTDARFRWSRPLHRGASVVVAVIALVHIATTAVFYDGWSPAAVWFSGTGLGLLLLAVINWAHVGVEPCILPTAPVVRAANWVFTVFGVAALMAVPEPQAGVLVLALLLQAVAARTTLRGPT
ncbi:MAG: hypothetical protein ACR2L6_01380 [Gemmatimonadaceae bacterium]